MINRSTKKAGVWKNNMLPPFVKFIESPREIADYAFLSQLFQLMYLA